MLDSLSRPRRALVLAVASVTVLGALAIGALLYLGRSAAVDPVMQNTPGPVLLVPGYGGSTSALDVLADALRARGRDATVVQLAGDGTGDLRVQAEVLDEAVRAALDRSEAESVDVVGYSAGGVVARLWVADLGGGNYARRVVTLGTPSHGTDVADAAAAFAPGACPLACRQLASGSDLLRGLNAGDETPAGPRWVSIWTTSDELVVPPESAALEGAVNFSVQQVCGRQPLEHGDLPRNELVIRLTLAQLGVDVPTPPTPADC